jgi:chemotaxis protein MotB
MYISNTGAAAEQTAKQNDLNKDEADSAEELKEALQEEQLKESETLAEAVSEALVENGIDKDVDIEFTSQYVQLTLKGSVLFDSGSADLKSEAMPMVSKIAMILERYATSTIEIEGHTDNVPIHTSHFESNDVLSSYRALAMFDYLVANTSIDPSKIKHSGRGEYIPVADNSTPEGRAKNRRIEIKIYNSLSAEN